MMSFRVFVIILFLNTQSQLYLNKISIQIQKRETKECLHWWKCKFITQYFIQPFIKVLCIKICYFRPTFFWGSVSICIALSLSLPFYLSFVCLSFLFTSFKKIYMYSYFSVFSFLINKSEAWLSFFFSKFNSNRCFKHQGGEHKH